MKIRLYFVSNSSSQSFIIKNLVDDVMSMEDAIQNNLDAFIHMIESRTAFSGADFKTWMRRESDWLRSTLIAPGEGYHCSFRDDYMDEPFEVMMASACDGLSSTELNGVEIKHED